MNWDSQKGALINTMDTRLFRLGWLYFCFLSQFLLHLLLTALLGKWFTIQTPSSYWNLLHIINLECDAMKVPHLGRRRVYQILKRSVSRSQYQDWRGFQISKTVDQKRGRINILEWYNFVLTMKSKNIVPFTKRLFPDNSYRTWFMKIFHSTTFVHAPST